MIIHAATYAQPTQMGVIGKSKTENLIYLMVELKRNFPSIKTRGQSASWAYHCGTRKHAATRAYK